MSDDNTERVGDRIKTMYEDRTRFYLPRRCYTIIRIDGKNFSRYTKNLDKPFDIGLAHDFDLVTKGLCAEVMGCCLGYTQSDEITLVLTDFSNANSDAWFDGNLQKLSSVSASMATMLFNRARLARADGNQTSEPGACFDARAFSIADREEVVSYLAWRQADAYRNSVSAIARNVLSHKDMLGVNIRALREMLVERGINLATHPAGLLYGRVIRKETYFTDVKVVDVENLSMTQRHRWVVGDAPSFATTYLPVELLPERERFGRNSQ